MSEQHLRLMASRYVRVTNLTAAGEVGVTLVGRTVKNAVQLMIDRQ
jgi:hypothetical protein